MKNINKIFLILITSIFLISLTSASPGTYKQGQNITLLQTCADCTTINISKITAPNGTILVSDIAMTKDGSAFNYTLNSSFTNDVGTYRVSGIGNPDSTDEVWTYSFFVNYKGDTISSAQAMLYIGLIVVIILVFIFTLGGINKLPKGNDKDEFGRILSINKLKYLRPALWFFEWMLFIALLFLTSNIAFAYLNEQMFAKILFVLFQISFGLTPLIVVVWIIWIFVEMFHDKEFQDMLNRGFFPQGKI